MSLPSNPNLDNLKKQAKTLRRAQGLGDVEVAQRIAAHLPRLSGTAAEAVLASEFSLQEAQFVIARELGFASWPRLVAKVEGSGEKAEPEQIIGYTSQVKQSWELARQEARRLGHNYIGTEHLLLGLIKVGKGPAVDILEGCGLDLPQVVQAVEDYTASSGKGQLPDELPFTPRAKQVLEMAANQARALGAVAGDTQHILLALVADQEGVAAQILSAYGVDFEGVWDRVSGQTAIPKIRRRRPQVSRPPTSDFRGWRDEVRQLADEELQGLKGALDGFFAATQELGFVPVLFLENCTLRDLVGQELERRQA